MDDDDPKSPMHGKSIVNVFGVPLFAKDSDDDVPDVLTPAEKPSSGASSSGQSGGFFDVLNPFKK